MVTITEQTLVLQAGGWSVGLTPPPPEKHFQLRSPPPHKKGGKGQTTSTVTPQKQKKNAVGALTTQPHLALRLKKEHTYTSAPPLDLR